MAGINWADASEYTRGDKERVPRVWRLDYTGEIDLLVHRWVRSDGWFMTSRRLEIERAPLAASGPDAAKVEALEKVRSAVKIRILNYQKALKEIDS